MDDIKKKLGVLGGVLGLGVIIFIGYSLASGSPSNASGGRGVSNVVPVGILVKKYDEQVGYKNAKNLYHRIITIVENDTTDGTKGVSLGTLQQKYAKTVSDEIKRFCRRDTMNIKYFNSLRQEAADLMNRISADENLNTSQKELSELLKILDKARQASRLSDRIESKTDTSTYTEGEYNTFFAKIIDLENTDYINDNPNIISKLKICHQLLSNWQTDQKEYEDLKNLTNTVEIINTDCNIFKGKYYQRICEKRRYDTYAHKFTMEAETFVPHLRRYDFITEEMDCSEIRNAPYSSLLAAKNPAEKEWNYYKDCREIVLKYKALKTVVAQ